MTDNHPGTEQPFDGNVKIICALLTGRTYDRLTTTMAQTDLKHSYKVVPTLQRAAEQSCNELDFVKKLPPGLAMKYCQVEHEVTHAVGAAALLCRLNEAISDEVFDHVGTQISKRARQLFSSNLTQRATSVSPVQAQLDDANPDEAGRFYSAFNSTFVCAADLSIYDPECNADNSPLRIHRAQIDKPSAVSGKILELICVVKHTQKTVASISIQDKRGLAEIQYDDGGDAYVLDLLKRLGGSVKLKVAEVNYPGGAQEKQKFRLLEVIGVEQGPWQDIASCYFSAAQFLSSCPAIAAEKNLPVVSVKNTWSVEVLGTPNNSAPAGGSRATPVPRRNRKSRNPL